MNSVLDVGAASLAVAGGLEASVVVTPAFCLPFSMMTGYKLLTLVTVIGATA